MVKTINIATRCSALALKQTDLAIAQLKKVLGKECCFNIIKIKTTGDKILDKNLYEIGGKSLFTKEIEEALLEGVADIAVHSMKDVTAEFAPGLIFKSYLKREDPRDALISKFKSIEEMPANAKIGTSSSRRRLFTSHLRPDLELVALRGNVPTRLEVLKKGNIDAIVLAMAGLIRLGIDPASYSPISPENFIPAICQGVIGIQSRIDYELNHLIAETSDKETEITTLCERAFLKYFNASCKTPIAGYARIVDNKLLFDGMYQYPTLTPSYITLGGEISEPEELGLRAARLIK